MHDLDFSGQVVLVTGGAQGIGRGIVEAFARRGAQVVIADRQREQAEAVAAELCAQGYRVEAMGVDLAEAQAVFECVEGLPQLDILVHNAGYFPLTAFEDITPDILHRTLAVNLSALFWLTQAALPAFREQGRGCVLVTSSVTGNRVGYPGLSHYAASKAGVNGFIRNAALELAPLKVRVALEIPVHLMGAGDQPVLLEVVRALGLAVSCEIVGAGAEDMPHLAQRSGNQ
ncbi:SDR family NAD(P)-dependent oxidoreductase [Pseudomonas sp. P7759]|uniref:SDR family NAD(P)-dependent oxidoreductase n=1 Tax=Pseudomonas sp. P7759 TaxID=2738831 RepID=UPI003528B203